MQMSRVILANEPRLLRGMLRRAIAKVPGLEVVGEVTDPAELAFFAGQSDAQWVIVSIWPGEMMPGAVQSLLAGRSTPCILGIAADGSQAKIVCAGANEDMRDGLSLDDLIAILRKKEVNYSGNS